MIDLASISDHLFPGADGIWYAGSRSPISYPVDGNRWIMTLEDRSYWFRCRNRNLIWLMDKYPPNGTFFDVGGGNGIVAQALEKAGREVVLLEPGEDGIRAAAQRGVRHLICATLEDAGFHPGSLPAVGIFDVLEHIENDAGFLQNLHTLLIPAGRLYLTVPAYCWLWSNEDVDAGHFRRYSPGSLKKILESSGFIVEFMSPFFGILPLPIFFFRTIPSLLRPGKFVNREKTNAELAPSAEWLTRLMEGLFGMELGLMRRGITPLIGGSLLVCARKE
ncbi:MAG TPA: class I SAM-dependent methyltransferase [Anaerolineaceae bacterium]